MMRRAPALALLTAALLLPAPASAHLVDMRFGDFYGGAMHLLTGLQYALLLAALCILAALAPPRISRWVLLVVPLGLLAGGLAAMAPPLASDNFPLASLSLPLGAVLLAVGGLTAWGRALPLPAIAGVCAIAGLLLGIETGLAMTAQSDRLLFIAGMVLSALAAQSLVLGGLTALAQRAPWAPVALRALGSWVSAVALLLLVYAVLTPAAV